MTSPDDGMQLTPTAMAAVVSALRSERDAITAAARRLDGFAAGPDCSGRAYRDCGVAYVDALRGHTVQAIQSYAGAAGALATLLDQAYQDYLRTERGNAKRLGP